MDKSRHRVARISATSLGITMSLSLGLNEHHYAQVVAYMRFARYNKVQQMRTIDTCFEDMKCSRLGEATFTSDEVEEILDSLQQVVHADVESELINMSHTNILMLRQMFQQAESWHLKLQADISDLENVELLDKIKDFEEQEFSGKKKDSTVKVKLLPMNEAGGSALLQKKIKELEEDNEKLKQRLSKLENQSVEILQEKEHLSQELGIMQKCISNANDQQQKSQNNEELKQLEAQMANLRSELKQSKKVSDNFEVMESDLSSTKHELLKVNEMLEMAEKELEKKVSQTTPFKNLKLMLQKKNEQMKELRQRLSKYEETCDE